jgi:hypothetical protein
MLRVLRRPIVLGSVIACLSLSLLGASGCRRGGSTSQPSVDTPGGTDESSRQTQIEDQLKSALYQLQPENLGIDAQLEDAVSVLNNWWSAVEAAGLQPTGLTPPDVPADRVPEVLLPRLQKDAYDALDGRHIRSSYLAKVIADRIAGQSDDETERVVRLFEWVCRNIALAPEDEPQPPLTLYELLLVGRGWAVDRAVVFGGLLKQWRLDSVVLTPKDQTDAPGPIVVGVLVDDDVLLFDPQLGLPIPRGDASATARIDRPATLREIREHPDWLKALAARSDQPYEPTAEQIAAARVDAITSVTAWAPRMWKLEQLLPGASLCALYEPPARLGEAPGLFERIAAADPSWEADQIGVWAYPLQREVQFVQLDPNHAQLMRFVLDPFLVPIEVKFNEKGEVEQRQPTMRHLKTRTLHLLGRTSDAIAQYVSIRQLAVTPLRDPALGQIYQRAAEDALFWSCLCKFDAGEHESAIDSLGDYLRRYRRGGKWVGAAWLLQAECQLALQRLPDAVASAKGSAADEAYRATSAILARRWTEAKEAPK